MLTKLRVIFPLAVTSILVLAVCIGCSDDDGTKPETTGTLEISSTPAGAAIFIDGEDRQKQTPHTFAKVEPDSYSITLTMDLFEDWDTTVAVAAGKKTIVNATLIQNEFLLTVNIFGNGTVTKSPDQATYCCGDPVELTAVEDPGNVFEGWSGALTGDRNPDTVLMGMDRTVNATFAEIMEVRGTIRLAGGGTLVRPIAFLDTSSSDQVVIFRDAGWLGDPATGEFVIQFYPQGLDSLPAIVAGFDDVNQNLTIDPNEPWGWWDISANGSWEAPDDFVTLRPGEPVTGADVVLYVTPPASQALRKRPADVILELR